MLFLQAVRFTAKYARAVRINSKSKYTKGLVALHCFDCGAH